MENPHNEARGGLSSLSMRLGVRVWGFGDLDLDLDLSYVQLHLLRCT